MARKDLFELLQGIAEPIVQSFGLCLWGIEVLQSGRPVVRIFVDVPAQTSDVLPSEVFNDEVLAAESTSLENHSATVEQCARISRLVALTLEVEDLFSSAYVLEVSSPGLSRPFFKLEQMPAYIGQDVEVVLVDFLPENSELPSFAIKRKKFLGKLESVQESSLNLAVEHDNAVHSLNFAWDMVRKATRVHIFVQPEKPGKKRKESK